MNENLFLSGASKGLSMRATLGGKFVHAITFSTHV